MKGALQGKQQKQQLDPDSLVTTRAGHAQLFFESAIAIPQLKSTSAIAIPQLFKAMLIRNRNFS
jgi:hypothetical protein